VSKEESVWGDKKISEPSISRISKAERIRDMGRPLGSGPRTYVDTNTAKVSRITGYTKEKSAITVAPQFGGRKRYFNGEHFWVQGYALSTVGYEELKMRAYLRNQKQLGQTSGADEKMLFNFR
jgi:hypothetical protein